MNSIWYTYSMIPKKNKVPKQAFPGVMKGKQFPGAMVTVIITQSISGNTTHGAVIIAKKYAKKAVMRNLIKRIMFREIQKNMDTLPKKTLVFMVKKAVTQDSLQHFHKEVQHQISTVSTHYEKNN